METVTGQIDSLSRIYNGGWRFGRIFPDINIVGEIPPDFEPGDVCAFQGDWKDHPKYGKQFIVKQATREVPKDVRGMREYLDRHLKWIGPMLAEKLLAEFGDDLFNVIENDPERLIALKGITAQRAEDIHKEYLEIKKDQELDVFFATNNISLRLRAKLIDEYKTKAAAVREIKSDPYGLAEEVFGVGFKKADAIATSLGILKDDYKRIGAGIHWTLLSAAQEGHCYLPPDEMLVRCIETLELGQQKIQDVLSLSIDKGRIISTGYGLYSDIYYRAETSVAEKLKALKSTYHEVLASNITHDSFLEMDEDQQKALNYALSSKILVITGGPGVGKTYTINKILEAIGENRNIKLAAPTGKAAKRMAQMCGRADASTIHRLLEYSVQGGCFTRNQNRPIECDTLIIDETSMIDIRLMHSLLDAINPSTTQIIFVGDVDQLPSVGPGNVLGDMITSMTIPTVRLHKLHRQAEKSLINQNARRINDGSKIFVDNSSESNFHFISEEDPQRIHGIILKSCQAIPNNTGFSFEDVQVLCPQKKGPIGTLKLNESLREVLNPHGEKIVGTQYRIGDKVIQVRNNYDLGVFNGDIGYVRGGDEEELLIEFDDIEGTMDVVYPAKYFEDLQLAYALTIHKSQGSEFPVVVIPVHTTNYIMLKRNLLYTGITRGKELVVLVGTMKAVNLAIRTIDASTRWTGLRGMLNGSQS